MNFKQFCEEKKTYDFSSVLYMLPKDVAKDVYSWGVKNVSDKDIAYDGGREDEMHVTVLYGLHDKRATGVRVVIKDVFPFSIKLGKISAFTTNEEFDVLKVEVLGEELHDLNRLLRDKMECTVTYPEYKPHVTIAYLKKGKAKGLVGSGVFRGVTMKVENVVFSSTSGMKIPIVLKG